MEYGKNRLGIFQKEYVTSVFIMVYLIANSGIQAKKKNVNHAAMKAEIVHEEQGKRLARRQVKV